MKNSHNKENIGIHEWGRESGSKRKEQCLGLFLCHKELQSLRCLGIPRAKVHRIRHNLS